jgi:surface antigen
MRDKDLASLTQTLNKALDASADGQTTEWTNDGLGNSVPIKASLTPKDTADQNGMHCRHVAVTVSAKSQDQSWLPLFCKTGQGWKMQKH